MPGTRRSEVGYDQTLGLIVERFREDSEQVTREPLPTRWVELILHLDEQECNRRARPQSSGVPGVVEAEIAVNKQEEVLREVAAYGRADRGSQSPSRGLAANSYQSSGLSEIEQELYESLLDVRR
jgi:hypothetical protein